MRCIKFKEIVSRVRAWYLKSTKKEAFIPQTSEPDYRKLSIKPSINIHASSDFRYTYLNSLSVITRILGVLGVCLLLLRLFLSGARHRCCGTLEVHLTFPLTELLREFGIKLIYLRVLLVRTHHNCWAWKLVLDVNV